MKLLLKLISHIVSPVRVLMLLVMWGFHGKKHQESHQFLEVVRYKLKKNKRFAKLAEWMHNNGIGA